MDVRRARPQFSPSRSAQYATVRARFLAPLPVAVGEDRFAPGVRSLRRASTLKRLPVRPEEVCRRAIALGLSGPARARAGLAGFAVKIFGDGEDG